MKDFAKKHPINKSKAKRVKTSLRAKRELNQPLKIKHLLIIAAMSALLLFTSNVILQTDVVNIRGNVSNPKVEFPGGDIGAVVSIQSDTYDFGEIKKGDNGTCVFELKNDGFEPLIISKYDQYIWF